MPDDHATLAEEIRAELEANPVVDPRDEEITRLRAELTQTRLDLAQSEAIREAFVDQMVEVAGDIARALGAVESAFHAGYLARIEGATSPDEAYRVWAKKLQERS